MAVIIEKGIPVPTRSGLTDEIRTLVSTMEPGDSVFVETSKSAHTISQALLYRKKKGATRKENNGYRVWRVA